MKNDRLWVGTEIRAITDDPEKRIATGYAAKFNSYSEDLGGYREVVRAGAFRKTLNDGPDIAAVWNHNMDIVVGRVSSGTLILSEDADGLPAEIHFGDSPEAISKFESIKRGDVYQMSFRFRVIKDRWTTDENKDLDLRELLEVQLYEVSPVVFPAYKASSIGVRSIEETTDDLESSLTRAIKRGNQEEISTVKRAIARLTERRNEPVITPLVEEPIEHSAKSLEMYKRKLQLEEYEYEQNRRAAR